MKNENFVLNAFNKVNKKIVLLGIMGAACIYFLNKKIDDRTKEIENLKKEINGQKGD